MRKSQHKLFALIVFCICTILLVACGQTVIEQENDLLIDSVSQNYYGEIEVTFKNPQAIKYGLEFRINKGEWLSSVERLPNTYALIGYVGLDDLDLINKKITIDIRKQGFEDKHIKYRASVGIKNKAEFLVKPCLSFENSTDILIINDKHQELFDFQADDYKVLSDEQKEVLSYIDYTDDNGRDDENIEYFTYAIMFKGDKIIFKEISIIEECEVVYYKFTDISGGLFKVAPTGMRSYDDAERAKLAYDKTYNWVDVTADGVDLSFVTCNLYYYNDTEYCYYSFFVMCNETPLYTQSVYNNLKCFVVKTANNKDM